MKRVLPPGKEPRDSISWDDDLAVRREKHEKYERQRNRWQSRAEEAIRTASQHAASEAPRAMMGAASSLAS